MQSGQLLTTYNIWTRLYDNCDANLSIYIFVGLFLICLFIYLWARFSYVYLHICGLVSHMFIYIFVGLFSFQCCLFILLRKAFFFLNTCIYLWISWCCFSYLHGYTTIETQRSLYNKTLTTPLVYDSEKWWLHILPWLISHSHWNQKKLSSSWIITKTYHSQWNDVNNFTWHHELLRK